LAAAAAVAVLLLVLTKPWSERAGDTDVGPIAGRVYVQFVVDVPSAETVHVVGDFTEWEPSIALADPDGDGVWSGRVALEPGVHEYMFVIDGADWMTDPNASSYHDDGFGQQNAVLAVSELDGT
jgi:1,4-alpha-glucan branching enzyme